MIAQNLFEAFPFASNYFSELFKNAPSRFPQSIVFEGIDPYAQCFFALELARILNCEQNAHTDCQCLNCRWIRQNTHPAVNFVSQIHFKPSNDDSKTVISISQAKEIEKSLRETSDYHRFFIFFDAKASAPDKMQTNSYQTYLPQGYNICPDLDWSMNHINIKTFNPAAPNVLLKSVEEPPERTTFVFLTRNRADLINTIVSRSQVFKLSSKRFKEQNCELAQILQSYSAINYENAFEISTALQNYIKDNDLCASYILDEILEFLVQKSKTDFNPYIQNDIKYTAEAKKWSNASMSDKVIFDTLFLKIAKGRL